MIATAPEDTSLLTKAVSGLGGNVIYEADELGYLRVSIPSTRVWELATLPQIQLANYVAESQFDVSLQGQTRATSTARRSAEVQPDALPTPSAYTPYGNPFTGVTDVGADQFIHDHPTFDGRGVTIGFTESGDPRNPVLQQALSLDGKPIPKIEDIRNIIGPFDATNWGGYENQRNGWVDMRREVTASRGHIEFDGHFFSVPSDGPYRVGLLDVRKIDFINTRQLHGTAYARPGTYPILWDQASGKVWIDTNQSGTFLDKSPLMDFRTRHDVGILHVIYAHLDLVRGPVPKGVKLRDDYSFVIQTDTKDNFIDIIVPFWDHSQMVTASAVGSRFFGGSMGGIAPGARIVCLYGGGSYASDLEGMIYLARYPVDIISSQFDVWFANDDGHSVYDTIVNRIVTHYGTVILVGAANDGPSLTDTESPANADAVLSVGGYISRHLYLYNFGRDVPHEDYIAGYSSRGPRADGALKPDVLAPTEWLSSGSLYYPGFVETRTFPAPYQIGDGTSQATPTAAGVVALLISAAKQNGTPYSPLQIKRALMSSARFLQRYQAYEQGTGLINVSSAWAALRRAAEPDYLAVDASVRTVSSNDLTMSNRGPGLFEREGWTAGMTSTRTLLVRAIQQSATLNAYDLRWVGNDGTFSSQPAVEVASQPVPLTVRIHPKTAGVHSALLEFYDSHSQNLVATTLLTIVAAEQFGTANHFTITHHGSVEVPGVAHYFFKIPPGVQTFSVGLDVNPSSMHSVVGSETSLFFVHAPDDYIPLGTDPAMILYHGGTYWRESFPSPLAGVWEVDVSPETWPSSATGAHPSPIEFSISGSVFAAERTGAENVSNTFVYQFKNLMAPLHVRPMATSGAVISRTEGQVSRSEPIRAFEINIPIETSEVRAQIDRTSDESADLNVYLFECVRPKQPPEIDLYQGLCNVISNANSLSGNPIASTRFPIRGSFPEVGNPRPGRWVIAVVAAKAPQEPVAFSIEYAIVSRRFGMLESSFDQKGLMSTGASWTQKFVDYRSAAAPTGFSAAIFPEVFADEPFTFVQARNQPLGSSNVVDRAFFPVWSGMDILGR